MILESQAFGSLSMVSIDEGVYILEDKGVEMARGSEEFLRGWLAGYEESWETEGRPEPEEDY